MYSIFDAEEPIPCHWSLLYPLKRRLLAKVDMEVRCSQEPGYPLLGIVITHKISIFFPPPKATMLIKTHLQLSLIYFSMLI